MADPSFIAVSQADEGYFVERYTGTREFAGDTWHQTRAAAVRQAEWEYGGRVGGWVMLDDEITDLDTVLQQLARMTIPNAD
jgi:hypothetical protein